MKRILSLVMLIALSALLINRGPVALGQDDGLSPEEGAQLEAAIEARAQSPEFMEKAEVLRKAQEAEQAVISAIPEIRVIDSQLAELQRRIGELFALRNDVVEQNAALLQPYKEDIARAEQEFAAADPVLQLLDQLSARSEPEKSE